MPRQRMVKPEFFDSESLALCSIEARLAFIGLWVMGDDYGNQRAQLFRLQHRIFPYDEMGNDRFLGLLCELEETGCIKGYEIDGERYITVPNFNAYQTVRKPSATNVPEPPKATLNAKTTKVIRKWRTSGAPVAHGGGSDAPVSHECATSDPERKKEGSNFSLREKIANARSEAEAASAASLRAGSEGQGGPECARCAVPMQATNAYTTGKRRRIFRCPLCGDEAEVGQ